MSAHKRQNAPPTPVAATVKFVHTLRALSCSVALDDFSAGYSSYRSLETLGVDMVKIDGSFIETLGSEAGGRTLGAVADRELAQSLGVSTVGEWVTGGETARLLENAGIAYMQGYFFGAPELAAPLRGARPTGASN